MKSGILLLLSLPIVLGAWGEPTVKLCLDGSVSCGETGIRFLPTVADKGWARTSLRRTSHEIAKTGDRMTCGFAAELKDKPLATFDLSVAPTAKGVKISTGFRIASSRYLEALMQVCSLPSNRVAGATYSHDGKPAQAYPSAGKQTQFKASRLVCSAPGLADAIFSSASPLTVVIRGRTDGGADVRFAPVYHANVEKGDVYPLVLKLDLGSSLAVGREEIFTIREGADWVAWDDVKDIEPGSALDLSSQGFTDAPAGKHGWLRNVDGHLEFEKRPGVPVRFAGVNFCGTMNYPTHAEADRIIRRLRALGYNSIRLHHYDAGLVQGSKDNLTFNPKRLDQLDYLVAKAVENGLYVTTDLYVSRPVTWRQMGYDRDGSPNDVPGGRWLFKLLIAFHEGAYANWKKFATNFLEHVNPYTGRRYADEPGMPLISMVNEASYRMGWRALTENDCFRAKWATWAEAKRRADPGFAAGADLSDPAKFGWDRLGRLGDTAPAAFMADNETRNFARQLADMRALGAKALFTSINHLPYYVPDMSVRRSLYGYFDDHIYIDHPSFPGKAWNLPNLIGNMNPLQDPDCRLDKHAYMKIEGLPATISEFNFCGPNDYRGMNGLLTGAFMAGQDVSAYWRFAYAHAVTNMYDHSGKPGSFDVSTDPVNCAAERMIHFLYLRGDFEPFPIRVMGILPDDRAAATRGGKMSQLFPAWRQAFTWKARVSSAFPGDVPENARTYDFLATTDAAKAPFDLPDDTRLLVDRKAGTVRLATARSCGVSVSHGRLSAGALDVDVRAGGPMTTIGVASLDARPIPLSRRLLLTHLTDAESAGTQYADATCRLKIGRGSQTTVIRAGEAVVRLRLEEPARCAVYGLDAAGRRIERLPAMADDGQLVFTASVRGPKGARICYEIVR